MVDAIRSIKPMRVDRWFDRQRSIATHIILYYVVWAEELRDSRVAIFPTTVHNIPWTLMEAYCVLFPFNSTKVVYCNKA